MVVIGLVGGVLSQSGQECEGVVAVDAGVDDPPRKLAYQLGDVTLPGLYFPSYNPC